MTAVPVNPAPDPLSGGTLGNVIAVTAADGTYALVDLPRRAITKVQFSTGCGDSRFCNAMVERRPFGADRDEHLRVCRCDSHRNSTRHCNALT